MSVQFGRWNFEDQPPAPDYIDNVSATLAPYGPDSNESYGQGGVKMLYRAFHTTKESHRETQPHVSESGTVITWDGRLDNRAELIGELRSSLKINSATAQVAGADFARMKCEHEFTDVEVVAAAYEKWQAHSLGKLMGDWALSIWNPRERSVLLARDLIGTKHLFYSMGRDDVTWSTILDPLVLFAGRTFDICEEYVAGWFSHFPAAHLTPYFGINAVPPSSSVLIRPGKKHIVRKYWDFDSSKRIRYRSDAEYEEHFRAVFATAVERRLRSDRPVISHLSGGMDSSAIVCMADAVTTRGGAEMPRLDTISWFDNSYDQIEPDTNELRWITKVEEKRGRIGYHIDLASLRDVDSPKTLVPELESDRFVAIPIPNRHSEFSKHYSAYVMAHGYRVVLSGLAGDSVTGNTVPTPSLELQNLLARARFFVLAQQLKVWAGKMRETRLRLLWDAVRGFSPFGPVHSPEYVRRAAPWLLPCFVRRNRAALCGYPSKVKFFGPLPSFLDNVHALDAERRLLAFFAFPSELLCEVRYPYVDRGLLEYMYAIPREQIIGVGRRRFLMKRALAGIVPDELLNRRRQVFVPPEPKKDRSMEWPGLGEIGHDMVSSSIGFIDPHRFWEALEKARRTGDDSFGSLTLTLTLESWLRQLTTQGVLTNSATTKRREYSSPLEAKELPASAQAKSSAS